MPANPPGRLHLKRFRFIDQNATELTGTAGQSSSASSTDLCNPHTLPPHAADEPEAPLKYRTSNDTHALDIHHDPQLGEIPLEDLFVSSFLTPSLLARYKRRRSTHSRPSSTLQPTLSVSSCQDETKTARNIRGLPTRFSTRLRSRATKEDLANFTSQESNPGFPDPKKGKRQGAPNADAPTTTSRKRKRKTEPITDHSAITPQAPRQRRQTTGATTTPRQVVDVIENSNESECCAQSGIRQVVGMRKPDGRIVLRLLREPSTGKGDDRELALGSAPHVQDGIYGDNSQVAIEKEEDSVVRFPGPTTPESGSIFGVDGTASSTKEERDGKELCLQVDSRSCTK